MTTLEGDIIFNHKDAQFNRSRFNQSPGVYAQVKTRKIYTPEPAFNRMGFGQAPFNSKQLIDELGLYGEGNLSVSSIATLSGKAILSGAGQLHILVITYGEAHLSGQGMVQGEGVRVRYGDAGLSGIGELYALPQRYELNYIEFLGDFAPGDEIVINTERFTVTLNGEFVMEQVEGDYFNLNPGDNLLIYEDTESNRQVKINVKHKDRWV